MKTPNYKPFGLHAVLVSWEPAISEEIHHQVLQFENIIKAQFAAYIIETVPAYQSLAIFLKNTKTANSFIALLKQTHVSKTQVLKTYTALYTIPVCYETDYGIDLSVVANHTKVSEKEIITLHTAPIYTVYFIGFLPGFPYLGGLPEVLYTPRRKTPRSRLEAGSVAIGGKQTGVYPQDSPGGWHVIGKTPISLFQKQQSVLKAGDKVQFEAITSDLFKEISEAIKNNEYVLQKFML
jgi:inhibitor of KinA